MLQAAITFADHHGHEDIAVHRRFFGTWFEEGNLSFTNFLHISDNALHVHIWYFAGHDKIMRDAMRIKSRQRKITHLYRVINQFIIIGSDISTKAIAFGFQLRQGCGNTPGFAGDIVRALDINHMGIHLLTMHAEEHAGAIEEAVTLIEMGCTD